MKCPRDNSELILTSHKRVYAYCCPYCDGLLLQSKSLQVLKKNFSANLIDRYFEDLDTYKTSIKCPNCVKTMKSVTIGETEIDLCPYCGNGWFDNNEVKAIVKSHGTKAILENNNSFVKGLFEYTLFEIVANIFGFLLFF